MPVNFDDDLVALTLASIEGLRALSSLDKPPAPLPDSPKCGRCSLAGICLPDEVGYINNATDHVRPIYAQSQTCLPLYVQSAGSYLKKNGDQIIVEEKRERVAEARYIDTSQVVLFGHAGISTPALHECFRREIPVTFMSYGGWFIGHTMGTGHRNVMTRTLQYQASFDSQACLRLARRLVIGKIHNCRTLLRRNWKAGEGNEEGKAPPRVLQTLKNEMAQAAKAVSIPVLLGIEGNAARHYFENLTSMLSPGCRQGEGFDFNARNRRPPKDTINALLSFAYAMLTRDREAMEAGAPPFPEHIHPCHLLWLKLAKAVERNDSGIGIHAKKFRL